MHEVVPRSDPRAPDPVLQRARGRIGVGFRRAEDGTTRVAELFQEGCLKVRLPRCRSLADADLVVLNVAGGLTGGDRLSIEVALDEGARATVTTPACERVYRSAGGEALVQQRLAVGRGARLDWLPQETILFDRSRLRRQLDVELAADAEMTIGDAVLFGRAAMGETVKSGSFFDVRRIRRGGRLLFADATRVVDPFDRTLACPAALDGRVAMASVLHIGPELAAKRDALRTGFLRHETVHAGASIVDDVLVSRIVAPDGVALRRVLMAALEVLRESRPLPRLWFC